MTPLTGTATAFHAGSRTNLGSEDDVSLWEWVGVAIVTVVLGSYLMMLVAVLADIFRDHGLGGVGKAGWVLGLVLFPVVGVLVYLVTRGDGMGRRQTRRHVGG